MSLYRRLHEDDDPPPGVDAEPTEPSPPGVPARTAAVSPWTAPVVHPTAEVPPAPVTEDEPTGSTRRQTVIDWIRDRPTWQKAVVVVSAVIYGGTQLLGGSGLPATDTPRTETTIGNPFAEGASPPTTDPTASTTSTTQAQALIDPRSPYRPADEARDGEAPSAEECANQLSAQSKANLIAAGDGKMAIERGYEQVGGDEYEEFAAEAALKGRTITGQIDAVYETEGQPFFMRVNVVDESGYQTGEKVDVAVVGRTIMKDGTPQVQILKGSFPQGIPNASNYVSLVTMPAVIGKATLPNALVPSTMTFGATFADLPAIFSANEPALEDSVMELPESGFACPISQIDAGRVNGAPRLVNADTGWGI